MSHEFSSPSTAWEIEGLPQLCRLQWPGPYPTLEMGKKREFQVFKPQETMKTEACGVPSSNVSPIIFVLVFQSPDLGCGRRVLPLTALCYNCTPYL